MSELMTIAKGGRQPRRPRAAVRARSGRHRSCSVVFVALTGVWCLVGYALVDHRPIGERLTRHGHAALPLVSIALRGWLPSGARSLPS